MSALPQSDHLLRRREVSRWAISDQSAPQQFARLNGICIGSVRRLGLGQARFGPRSGIGTGGESAPTTRLLDRIEGYGDVSVAITVMVMVIVIVMVVLEHVVIVMAVRRPVPFARR
jgi:hypothetical protein